MHKHCLQFLLGAKMAPRETENNAYACFNYNYFLTFSGAHVRTLWRTGLTVATPLGLSLGFYSREGRFSVLLGHH